MVEPGHSVRVDKTAMDEPKEPLWCPETIECGRCYKSGLGKERRFGLGVQAKQGLDQVVVGACQAEPSTTLHMATILQLKPAS